MLYSPETLSFQDVSLHFQKKKKLSLLKILALEQERVCSPYRKQLSVSSFVRPQSPALHFIKLGVGSGDGRKYREKSSLCNAVFSSSHSNTSCLHDSLAEAAKHAIGPEGRDSAQRTALHKRGLGTGKGRAEILLLGRLNTTLCFYFLFFL